MAKFIYLLLVVVLAVAGADDKGVPSTSKLEAAARSGNWDEFSNLLSENVAQKLTANKLSVPLLPFIPPLPPLPSLSSIPSIPSIPSISSIASIPSMLPIPPIPPISSIPSMLPIPPIPDINFPSFPSLTSFKESKGSRVSNTYPEYSKLTSFKELRQSKSEPVTKFSRVVFSTVNSTTIDENGNVIEMGETSVVSSNNNEVQEFHVGNNPTLVKSNVNPVGTN